MDINTELVTKLINEQFPEWSHLSITPVKNSGNDNRTFHLGDHMSVRLPSGEGYAPQVEKEQKWLPILAEKLSLPIPIPLAKGNPTTEYQWPWSVNKWLEGDTLSHSNLDNLNQLAKDLGSFLKELQAVDSSGGPLAGEHNFYRGGLLSIYNDESKKAIENNNEIFDAVLLGEIWSLALKSKWESEPVWLHGDIAPGNLLVKDGKLSAVIDFGILGVGDPSCDAAIAWTFFDETSRKVFKDTLKMDEETWNRARGWALWKTLITYDECKETNPMKAKEAFTIICTIVEEYKKCNIVYYSREL